MARHLRRPRRVRPRLRLIHAVRKPRSDSALKTLPEEKQAEIGQLLASRSLTDVRSVLLEQGITTSEAALSEFWSWWQLRAALRRREDRVGELVEQLRHEDPAIPEARLFSLGQSVFAALSIAEEDGRTWVNTQRLALERGKLALDRERHETATCEAFLRWYEDKRAREIADSKGMGNAEKIALLRQQMFRDLEPEAAPEA